MNTDYKLIYHKDTLKFLAKQELAVQERIVKGLTTLLTIPSRGDINK